MKSENLMAYSGMLDRDGVDNQNLSLAFAYWFHFADQAR